MIFFVTYICIYPQHGLTTYSAARPIESYLRIYIEWTSDHTDYKNVVVFLFSYFNFPNDEQ